MKSNSGRKGEVATFCGQVLLLISIFVYTGMAFGQNSATNRKGNLDLALQGPFVVCEADDNQSLMIYTIDPTDIKNPHEDAGFLTDFLDFRLTEGTKDYELRGDLQPGTMTTMNPQGINRAEFTSSCPNMGYYWSLKVPRPDEIYYTWPESIQLGSAKHCDATTVSATYSTRFVLRYRGVDLSKGFQVWDGKTSTQLNVLQIGSDATMIFQMPPIGVHPDHDKNAYTAMATIANVDSCMYTPTSNQPADKPHSHSMPTMTNNRNGHTDCHAPLIYLSAAKKAAN
jgi:hypothetical protein